jgi:hypothetical protein
MKTKNHLLINEMSDGKPRKTKMYAVISNHDGTELAEIKWDGAWRTYVSLPFGDMKWSAGCHREIANFLDNIMLERKKGVMKK